jgi:predicted alpha/beta-fold hydrolase
MTKISKLAKTRIAHMTTWASGVSLGALALWGAPQAASMTRLVVTSTLHSELISDRA